MLQIFPIRELQKGGKNFPIPLSIFLSILMITKFKFRISLANHFVYLKQLATKENFGHQSRLFQFKSSIRPEIYRIISLSYSNSF